MTPVQTLLFQLQDPGYKEFHYKLLPTIDPTTIIGIRVPQLRQLAKSLWRGDKLPKAETDSFLNALPHKYYDENMLHSLLLQQLKDYRQCLEAVEAFLPYIDNWAVCDSLAPKAFDKNRSLLIAHVRQWIASPHVYTCRFGIDMLMRHYLDQDFKEEYLALPLQTPLTDYYVRMVVAWYYATALAKQWDSAFAVVEQRRLDPWTHNKTIQKAIESYRITPQQKALLRTMRIVGK